MKPFTARELCIAGLLLGCSAGVDDEVDGTGAKSSGGGAPLGGQGGAPVSMTGGAGGDGAGFVTSGGGQTDGGSGAGIVNPCGTECGPAELCDGIHKGLDDDCDGDVDEECECSAGQASSCFRGDPSYRDDPGCAAGTMQCTELGAWGPCVGGKHAVVDVSNPELCFDSDPLGCHPINGLPFQTIDLAEGAGNFDNDADSEMYEITCPSGVDPCPSPNGSSFTPLQSGEYTIEYTKVVDGVSSSCSFPLFVGARGLRVELSWDYPATSSVDLDLHLKQPDSVLPWNVSGTGAQQDCGWGNCKALDFLPPASGTAPSWFPQNNVPPDPVNWYEDPVPEANLCYFAPRGQGMLWSDGMMGCHSPRLDLDNITCDVTETNPQDGSFCAPENINVDFPPKDQWMRVAVHQFSNFQNAVIHPTVKIFCDGALAAELGPQGFYEPEAPFTWTGADVKDVWLVADVLFHEDECVKQCIVQPLYLANSKTPVVYTEGQAIAPNGKGPPYAQNPFTQ
jgi:hypothetical protein